VSAHATASSPHLDDQLPAPADSTRHEGLWAACVCGEQQQTGTAVRHAAAGCPAGATKTGLQASCRCPERGLHAPPTLPALRGTPARAAGARTAPHNRTRPGLLLSTSACDTRPERPMRVACSCPWCRRPHADATTRAMERGAGPARLSRARFCSCTRHVDPPQSGARATAGPLAR
jgi:hypothetical protein